MVTIPDPLGATRCDVSVACGPGWVLVVADDAADRMMLFGLLERGGYRATVVDDADGAVELLRVEPFDLVLVGLARLDPDGYALARRLRTDRRLRHIPLVVIAGPDQPEAVTRCLRLGVEDCLLKPCEPVVLWARVADSVQKGQRRQRQAGRSAQ